MLKMNYYETFGTLVLLVFLVSAFLLLWAYWYVSRYLKDRLGKDGTSTFWDEFKGNYFRNEFIFLLLVYPMSSGEGNNIILYILIYKLLLNYSTQHYLYFDVKKLIIHII